MEATNAETIKRYVEMGIGISIIPETALYPTKNLSLETIQVSQYFDMSHYGVILRKGKHLTTWVKHFLNQLSPSLLENNEK
jgi:DNA-binding transcriptional LysR family regulator